MPDLERPTDCWDGKRHKRRRRALGQELEEGRSSSEEESESRRSSDSDSDSDDASDNDNDSDDSSEEDDAYRNVPRTVRQPSEKRNSLEEEEEALYGTEPIHRDVNGRAFGSDTTNSQLRSEDGLMSSLSDDEDNNDDDDDNDESHLMLQRYAQDGLLVLRRVRDLAARIACFNAADPEVAVTLATRERFLFGVASHHAGMLAAHKALVRTLPPYLIQSSLTKDNHNKRFHWQPKPPPPDSLGLFLNHPTT